MFQTLISPSRYIETMDKETFVNAMHEALTRQRSGHAVTLPKTPVPELGHVVNQLFPVDPKNRDLNFGSYGLAPLAITCWKLWYTTEWIDRNPDLVIREQVEHALAAVRSELSRFVGLPWTSVFLITCFWSITPQTVSMSSPGVSYSTRSIIF